MENNKSDKNDPNLNQDFKKLGESLAGLFRTVSENPQVRGFQDEVSDGIREFSATFDSEIQDFKESDTANRLKSNVNDLHKKVRTGEMGSKAKTELSKAINVLNDELQKFSENFANDSDVIEPED